MNIMTREICGENELLDIEEQSGTQKRRVWRRVHRPEEYAADIAKYLATELKIPYTVMAPFVPLARGVLKRWEDAAVEYTEYISCDQGFVSLRTIFLIHNFSNSAFYGLAERLLCRLGVGRSSGLQCEDTDIAWVLLGGVLNDYAGKAGVSRASTRALLEFRLRNSDYRTATTWYRGRVEIANLATGRVETLELPECDIRRIVAFAIDYHKKKTGGQYMQLNDETHDTLEFQSLMERYREISRAGSGSEKPAL